jgi:hypothetical protein
MNRSSYDRMAPKPQLQQQSHGRSNVILEEDEDVSAIKGDFYNVNDPDIQYVHKAFEAATVRAESVSVEVGHVPPRADCVKEQHEDEENYVQEADQEDDEAFEKFNQQSAPQLKKVQLRSSQSAYRSLVQARVTSAKGPPPPPNLNPNQNPSQNPNQHQNPSHNQDPASGVVRPTTVPAGPGRRRSGDKARGSSDQRQGFWKRTLLRGSQSAKQLTFSVVGQSFGLSSRLLSLSPSFSTQPQALPVDERGERQQEQLRRVVANRTSVRPMTADKNTGHSPMEMWTQGRRPWENASSNSLRGARDIDGARRQYPFHFQYRTATHEGRPLQQLNILTTPQNADARPSDPFSSVRPQTAKPMLKSMAERLMDPRQTQGRPITAQTPAAKSVTHYIATSYMRPYGGHKRPISAAINALAGHTKEKTQHINPERTKERYMKYLGELEKEAKQFVIEDEGPEGRPKPGSNSKGKTLLQHAKKQRRRVRLKRKQQLHLTSEHQLGSQYVPWE